MYRCLPNEVSMIRFQMFTPCRKLVSKECPCMMMSPTFPHVHLHVCACFSLRGPVGKKIRDIIFFLQKQYLLRHKYKMLSEYFLHVRESDRNNFSIKLLTEFFSPKKTQPPPPPCKLNGWSLGHSLVGSFILLFCNTDINSKVRCNVLLKSIECLIQFY